MGIKNLGVVAQRISERWNDLPTQNLADAAWILESCGMLTEDKVKSLVDIVCSDVPLSSWEQERKLVAVLSGGWRLSTQDLQRMMLAYSGSENMGNVIIMLAANYPLPETTNWLLGLCERRKGGSNRKCGLLIRALGKHARYYLSTGEQNELADRILHVLQSCSGCPNAVNSSLVSAAIQLLSAENDRGYETAKRMLQVFQDEWWVWNEVYVQVSQMIKRTPRRAGIVVQLLDEIRQENQYAGRAFANILREAIEASWREEKHGRS